GFRWFKNGSALIGQTNTSLTLTNISATNAGTYSAVVSSGCGSVTNSGTLTVLTTISATSLTNLVRCPGDTAVFGTIASGTGPYSYQWLKNGGPLEGESSSSLTLTNVFAADVGTYSVIVSGACGNATNSATLTVTTTAIAPPNLTVNCSALVPPPATNQA